MILVSVPIVFQRNGINQPQITPKAAAPKVSKGDRRLRLFPLPFGRHRSGEIPATNQVNIVEEIHQAQQAAKHAIRAHRVTRQCSGISRRYAG